MAYVIGDLLFHGWESKVSLSFIVSSNDVSPYDFVFSAISLRLTVESIVVLMTMQTDMTVIDYRSAFIAPW